jgi:hypothetical protein
MQEAKVSTSHLMRQAANLSREFEVVGSAAIDTQTTRPNPQQYGKAAELLLAHRQHRHHGAPPRTPKPGPVASTLQRGVISILLLHCVYQIEMSLFLPFRNVTVADVGRARSPGAAQRQTGAHGMNA